MKSALYLSFVVLAGGVCLRGMTSCSGDVTTQAGAGAAKLPDTTSEAKDPVTTSEAKVPATPRSFRTRGSAANLPELQTSAATPTATVKMSGDDVERLITEKMDIPFLQKWLVAVDKEISDDGENISPTRKQDLQLMSTSCVKAIKLLETNEEAKKKEAREIMLPILRAMESYT